MGWMVDGPACGGAVTELPRSLRGVGLCDTDLPVFQQSWWLDLAKADEDYRELVVQRDGAVLGKLAYVVVTNKFGNRLGFPPVWSHLGGPFVSRALAEVDRAEVIGQMIEQLPRDISLRFVCGPGVDS